MKVELKKLMLTITISIFTKNCDRQKETQKDRQAGVVHRDASHIKTKYKRLTRKLRQIRSLLKTYLLNTERLWT